MTPDLQMLLPSSIHQWGLPVLKSPGGGGGLPGCFVCLGCFWACWYQIWLLIRLSTSWDSNKDSQRLETATRIRGFSLPLVYISWQCFTCQSYPGSREVNRDFSCILLKCVVTPLSQRPSLPVLADSSVVPLMEGCSPVAGHSRYFSFGCLGVQTGYPLCVLLVEQGLFSSMFSWSAG